MKSIFGASARRRVLCVSAGVLAVVGLARVSDAADVSNSLCANHVQARVASTYNTKRFGGLVFTGNWPASPCTSVMAYGKATQCIFGNGSMSAFASGPLASAPFGTGDNCRFKNCQIASQMCSFTIDLASGLPVELLSFGVE